MDSFKVSCLFSLFLIAINIFLVSSAEYNSRVKSNKTNIARKPHIKRVVHPSLFSAWDEYSNLCILARFQASFSIKYETSSGVVQIIDKMPVDAISHGRCDQFDDKPMIDLVWKHSQRSGSEKPDNKVGFTFRMIFVKYPEDRIWGVDSMQLSYHTGHPVFKGAIKQRKFVVTSDRSDFRLQFHTPLKHSILCPSPPPIQMYDEKENMLVIARLSNMQLQAFEFGDPKETNNFDPFIRCGQVSFGSGVAHSMANIRNDGVTFAVGVITVFIACLTVVGYALYRSHMVGKEEYQKNVI